METIKVALLGLGTVGKGVYETIIQTHQQKLSESIGKRVEIVGILVKDKEKNRGSIPSQILVTTDINKLLALPELDVVFEAIVGVEPANTYIKEFINKGCHIISANKELLAHKGNELTEYATKNNRLLAFEAAVAGGIPLLRTILQLLQVNGITRLEGILNGTSNFILTKMRKEKANFLEVLHEAQELGYAEANPANDVEGTDAFFKLMILSHLIYQTQPDWESVTKIGVKEVLVNDLLIGNGLGLRLKLIATLQKNEQGKVKAEVRPTFVSNEHPLYNVEGVDNGIVLSTDLVGNLLLQGPGAGSKATASAMIEDLVYISQQAISTSQSSRYSTQEHFGSTEEPLWLTVIEGLTDETFKQFNFNLFEYLEKYKITIIKREIKQNNEGYLVGDLIRGTKENVESFLSQFQNINLRYYPVSPIGVKVESTVTPVRLLQTTS